MVTRQTAGQQAKFKFLTPSDRFLYFMCRCFCHPSGKEYTVHLDNRNHLDKNYHYVRDDANLRGAHCPISSAGRLHSPAPGGSIIVYLCA